jgi:hypothetical protein
LQYDSRIILEDICPGLEYKPREPPEVVNIYFDENERKATFLVYTMLTAKPVIGQNGQHHQKFILFILAGSLVL